jgi:SNF2 family DNA or RNA helicase
MGKGGILGDDMGLGKTIQVSAFFAGALRGGFARRFLVVAPKSLLGNWQKELLRCGISPSLVRSYHEGTAARRASALAATACPGGGVLLTTYGMVRHHADKLCLLGFESADQEELSWDWVALDEGHVVKNPKTDLTKKLRSLPCAHRLVISGTPIQNNLQELHTLVDFANEDLLGDRQTFRHEFERPILISQDKNATLRERDVGAAVATKLRRTYAPFFLRREKAEVFQEAPAAGSGGGNGAGPAAAAEGGGSQALQPQRGANSDHGAGNETESSHQSVPTHPLRSVPTLGRKLDTIVWLKPTQIQQELYLAFLRSKTVRDALNRTGTALAAMSVLKKICDHPALLSERATLEMERLDKDENTTAAVKDFLESLTDQGWRRMLLSRPSLPTKGATDGSSGARRRLGEGSPADGRAELIEASCKTAFTLALLQQLSDSGHRTLVFSQSRKLLDIVEMELAERHFTFCRIDGSVASAEERQARVERFQTDPSIQVFLLTSGVGGLGLTLTQADRVVIMDPNWNPAIDNQSVDRAYRIGQEKDVVVYRLVTCGTIEEKVYQRQVFKMGLSKTASQRSGAEETRSHVFKYFSHQELSTLFQASRPGFQESATARELLRLHADQTGHFGHADLGEHLEFVRGHEAVGGVSHHDLLFSKAAERSQAPEYSRFASRTNYTKLVGQGKAWASSPAALKKKMANQGRWTGSASISSMLSVQTHALRSTEKPSFLRAEVVGLRESLRRQKDLLERRGNSLPDGGERIQRKIDELELELRDKEERLGSSAPPRPAAEEGAQGVTEADNSKSGSVENVTSFLDKLNMA